MNLFLAGEGPTKPGKSLRPLARMIDQVAADVMLVQEVGSTASLQLLNQRLAKPYEYCAAVVGNSNRSIHLGLLSRIAYTSTSHRRRVLHDAAGQTMRYYADEAGARADNPVPMGFTRDLLQIELESSSRVYAALFGVHLKSRTNQSWQMHPADDMRLAECLAVRRVVTAYRKRHPGIPICILGDFNDRLTSEPLRPLSELALVDPLGEILRRTGRNPSTYWPKRRMRIDHILLSADVSDLVVPDSPRIHVSNMARTASDHYPVSIDLALPTADVI